MTHRGLTPRTRPEAPLRCLALFLLRHLPMASMAKQIPMREVTEAGSESELLVLQQAARLVTRSTDPKPAIQGILRLLSELLGLNRGRVLLPDEDSGVLTIEYAYGLSVAERQRGSYSIGEGVTGRVFQTGQLALIPDIDDEPTYLYRAIDRTTLPNEAVAFMAVPIILEEHPIGVLAAHRLRKRERPFQRDLALLQVVATLIGQVLQVKALVEERTAQLESENRLLRVRKSNDLNWPRRTDYKPRG